MYIVAKENCNVEHYRMITGFQSQSHEGVNLVYSMELL